MKIEELEKHCADAEAFAEKIGNSFEASFRVTVETKTIREGSTVRICNGLSGINLGSYKRNGVCYTDVVLKCKKVRAFLSKIKEAL